MTQTAEELFATGLERYQAGEDAATLLPLFKEVCDKAPKNSAAWTCLAWLQLLAGDHAKAVKSAQRAVKLNPQDPQARVNLAIALLDSGKAGVREHVDIASRIAFFSQELREDLVSSFEDGLQRNPDWSSLVRVKAWVLGEEG